MIKVGILPRKEFVSKIEKISLPSLNDFSLFHDPLWWQILEEGLGVTSIVLEAKEKDRILGFTPFFFTKRGPFKFFGSPLRGTFTPFLGPVWLKELSNQKKLSILKAQHDTLIEAGANYIEWGVSTSLFSELNFGIGKNWIQEYPETFLLKVEPDIELMWKKMEKRSRNAVRKAQKYNVKIRELIGKEEEIDLFYKMLKITFKKRKDVPHHPKKFFEVLIKYFLPAKKLLFLGAETKGRVVAMGLFLFNTKEIYYLSGASFPEYNKHGVNNLIQWYVIRFASQNKLKQYNFGGKGIPSIDFFKSSFGGKVKSYEKRIWVSSVTKPLFFVFKNLKKIFLKI